MADMDIFEFGTSGKDKGKEKQQSSSRVVIVNKKVKKGTGKKSGAGAVIKRKLSSQQKKCLQNAQEQALRLKMAKRKLMKAKKRLRKSGGRKKTSRDIVDEAERVKALFLKEAKKENGILIGTLSVPQIHEIINCNLGHQHIKARTLYNYFGKNSRPLTQELVNIFEGALNDPSSLQLKLTKKKIEAKERNAMMAKKASEDKQPGQRKPTSDDIVFHLKAALKGKELLQPEEVSALQAVVDRLKSTSSRSGQTSLMSFF